MKRVGMLTSGGDCQALNAAMRGVAKVLYNSTEDVEIYGFQDGYQGLIYGKFRLMTYDDFSGILTKGGTILGSSRTPYKLIREPGADGVDKVAAMKKTYKIDVDCANCANKMEEAAKNTAGVKDATVNFMMLKMIVEFEDGQDPKSVMQDVLKNCKKVEDDCEIFL